MRCPALNITRTARMLDAGQAKARRLECCALLDMARVAVKLPPNGKIEKRLLCDKRSEQVCCVMLVVPCC